jgi:hypothetical protein
MIFCTSTAVPAMSRSIRARNVECGVLAAVLDRHFARVGKAPAEAVEVYRRIDDLFPTGHRAGALSTPPELLSVITRGALERLLSSELPLALDRSAADLLRETVDVVLRGALVREGGTSGPGDRSPASGTSETPRRPT